MKLDIAFAFSRHMRTMKADSFAEQLGISLDRARSSKAEPTGSSTSSADGSPMQEADSSSEEDQIIDEFLGTIDGEVFEQCAPCG